MKSILSINLVSAATIMPLGITHVHAGDAAKPEAIMKVVDTMLDKALPAVQRQELCLAICVDPGAKVNIGDYYTVFQLIYGKVNNPNWCSKVILPNGAIVSASSKSVMKVIVEAQKAEQFLALFLTQKPGVFRLSYLKEPLATTVSKTVKVPAYKVE